MRTTAMGLPRIVRNASNKVGIAKANSDIEYLAMMTDIEMEQEEDEQEVQDHGEEE